MATKKPEAPKPAVTLETLYDFISNLDGETRKYTVFIECDGSYLDLEDVLVSLQDKRLILRAGTFVA